MLRRRSVSPLRISISPASVVTSCSRKTRSATAQPGPDTNTRYNRLGDVLTTVIFSPSKVSRLIWGGGPAPRLPTATDQALGAETFAVGPSVVVLTQPGNWTLGALGNQLCSTSGATDRPAINAMYFQPFLYYNLGNRLSTGASMRLRRTGRRMTYRSSSDLAPQKK